MKHPLLIVPLVAASVLAGCQHSPAPRTPSPAPTYACTPEAGGSPYPCNELQHKQQKDLDALYTEAEAVNTKLRAEMDRLYRAGGTAELTPILRDTTTGEARAALQRLMAGMKADALTSVGGEIRIVSVKREPGTSIQGSLVTLIVCVDASTTQVHKAGQYLHDGSAVLDHMYFSREDGSLKVSYVKGKAVDTCA